MQDTRPLILKTDSGFDFPAIRRSAIETLQVNLGYLCNLSCTHCHVNAGPTRTELMSLEVIDLVLEFIRCHDIKVLDMTGGSPEMNPHFEYLVTEACKLGVTVMDRCNPTILGEVGYEYLPDFFASKNIVVVASMPCYMEQNVDKQRGKGVYKESVEGLKKLNAVGYGDSDSKLELNLVYNPDEPVLPPEQSALQAEYKQALFDEHGIVFNQLFALANMPISRFGARLLAKGQFNSYMTLLRDAHLDDNLDTVMCKTLLSIDYQGYAYDCDFNQMLALPLIMSDKKRPHLTDLLSVDLENNPIFVASHCYGCTAGQGSSCGGALSE